MVMIIWAIGVVIFAKILISVDQDVAYQGKRMSNTAIVIFSLLWFISLPCVGIILYVTRPTK